MADWAKAAGAVGDTFKGISQATGIATGNSVKYDTGTIGKGNLSKDSDKKEVSAEDVKKVKETITSDKNCKDFSQMKRHISDLARDIDLYLFKYKKSAQKELGLDDKVHTGVMAQELEANPVTKPAVVQAPDGHLEVDTKELTMENTGLIADLVRRIEVLEAKLGEK